LVAGLGGLERFDVDHAAQLVDHSGDVQVHVRVDAPGHWARRFYDDHGHPFLSQAG
jgi:hypothetical protein